jgi:hypothetical protein
MIDHSFRPDLIILCLDNTGFLKLPAKGAFYSYVFDDIPEHTDAFLENKRVVQKPL